MQSRLRMMLSSIAMFLDAFVAYGGQRYEATCSAKQCVFSRRLAARGGYSGNISLRDSGPISQGRRSKSGGPYN